MNKLHWSSEYLHDCPVTHQPYMSKMELEQQASLMYPVSPFYASTIASPSASPLSSSGVIYGDSFVTSPYMHGQHPGSPDSLMSGLSSAPLYPQQQHHHQMPPQLVQSSSTSTVHSTNSTSSSAAAATAYLNETIAKASALPESFYPEFLQYSKESFEQSTTHRINNKKRNRADEEEKVKFSSSSSSSSEDDEEDEQRPSRKQKVEQQDATSTVTELRRQIHIQSEQKRRAQIKDGFEDLRTELPACLNKKMSKVTLLHRTVQHIQHLKSTQMTILAELERLVQENEQLRTFQQGVLQKQALENMYSIGNI
ncbi:hypothetical protein INT47_000387 [Mucor saturninus]|uniref:BHLH domain-containing protein n=1 Tax=Mucor saturninus TaxID=64648 RepID=A0A8H7UTM7_9FUNG|nr:hypothetical protein INT47_000387 [Mucor saturninus]